MGSSSMFGDDDTNPAATDDSSPWGFTPKKNAGRGGLVKSLLEDADVPEFYIDRFDGLQVGGIVGAGDARRFIEQSGIDRKSVV